jgi:hypothetical protein
MTESRENERGEAPPQTQQKRKRPYHKPAVRYEKVFETRALTCGKVQTTQGSCAHNRKTS